VLARFSKFLVVVALVTTTGLHWAVLQSVAWTTMLANNLRTQSLTEAVTRTFDGKHPCCLCKTIAAAQKSGKKTEFALQIPKIEFPPSPENLVLAAPSRFQLLPLTNRSAESLTVRPPTPPPRGLLV
jgi:hypothetical protein